MILEILKEWSELEMEIGKLCMNEAIQKEKLGKKEEKENYYKKSVNHFKKYSETITKFFVLNKKQNFDTILKQIEFFNIHPHLNLLEKKNPFWCFLSLLRINF